MRHWQKKKICMFSGYSCFRVWEGRVNKKMVSKDDIMEEFENTQPVPSSRLPEVVP